MFSRSIKQIILKSIQSEMEFKVRAEKAENENMELEKDLKKEKKEKRLLKLKWRNGQLLFPILNWLKKTKYYQLIGTYQPKENLLFGKFLDLDLENNFLHHP